MNSDQLSSKFVGTSQSALGFPKLIVPNDLSILGATPVSDQEFTDTMQSTEDLSQEAFTSNFQSIENFTSYDQEQLREIDFTQFVDKYEYRPNGFPMIELDIPFDKNNIQELLTASLIKLAKLHPQFLRDISEFEFLNQFAEGGFSKVWKANDLRTGKLCAVKELKVKSFTFKYLVSFVREIHTMAISQSRFVLNLVGFTTSAPLTIITEYLPNDSLFNHTNKYHRKEPLNGTQLTLIALCIAQAMIVLHSRNVIHRDLKAVNILLDEEMLPRLCDFGIARVITPNAKMTNNLGTPSHMPPEQYVSHSYNGKVDVFGFAMLLYEMAESHNCFNKVPTKKVEQLIQEGSRPPFKYTNRPLRDLIQRCWADDPNERPDFEEIFQEFVSGKVYFPGNDPSITIPFAQKVEKEISVENAIFLKPEIQDLDQLVYASEVIKDLENMLRNKQVVKTDQGISSYKSTFNPSISAQKSYTANPIHSAISLDSLHFVGLPFELLKDPSSPDFYSTVELMRKYLSPMQIPKVIQMAFDVFYHVEDTKAVKTLLKLFRELSLKDHMFLNELQETKLFTFLPFDQEAITKDVYKLLYIFIKFRPYLVDSTLRRLLIYFLTNYPYEAMLLFSNYARHLHSIKDPFSKVSLLLNFANNYQNIDEGSMYVDILVYMMTKFENIKKEKMPQVRQILVSFLKSKNDHVLKNAMRAICLLYDDQFDLPYKHLNSLLKYEDKAPLVASVLLRPASLPLSKHLFISLISRNFATNLDFDLVMKFVSASREHAKLALANLAWLRVTLPTTALPLLRLFLYLFIDNKFRNELIASKYCIPFLQSLSHHGELDFFISLHCILKRIRMTKTFASKLVKDGFVHNFTSQLLLNDSPENRIKYILTITQLCNLTYTEDFITALPILLENINERNEVTSKAIELISALSRYPSLAQRLHQPSLISYYKNLLNIDQYSDFAKYFLKNVNQFTASQKSKARAHD